MTTSNEMTRVMNPMVDRRWSVVPAQEGGFRVMVEDSWKGQWEEVFQSGACVRSTVEAAQADMVAMVASFDAMRAQ